MSATLIQVELWQYQSNCGGCHFGSPTAWNTDPEHFERIRDLLEGHLQAWVFIRDMTPYHLEWGRLDRGNAAVVKHPPIRDLIPITLRNIVA